MDVAEVSIKGGTMNGLTIEIHGETISAYVPGHGYFDARVTRFNLLTSAEARKMMNDAYEGNRENQRRFAQTMRDVANGMAGVVARIMAASLD